MTPRPHFQTEIHLTTLLLPIIQVIPRRHFVVRSGSALSEINPIHAGVPQGAIAAPLLFNQYTSDQPTTNHTITGDFTDNKAIMALNSESEISSNFIQFHLNLLQTW
jgi:hypothetical protein